MRQNLKKIFLSLLFLPMGLSGCQRQGGERGVHQRLVKNPLPLARIYQSPKIDGENIRGLQLSPDGQRVTFLRGTTENFRNLDLWQWEAEANKVSRLVTAAELLGAKPEIFSVEEKARRERQRITDEGIVEYHWSAQGDKILFPLNGQLYLYSFADQGKVEQLTRVADGAVTDPRFSPLGHYVSFIRNFNLVVIELKTKKEIAITTEGHGDKSYGVAEFIAQEEMGRDTGYWWSPDENLIALTEFDQTAIAPIKRLEIEVGELKVVEQRYPKAGKANGKIRLGVTPLRTNAIEWLPLGEEDHYLPHVQWDKNAQQPLLSYQIQSRDQKKLALHFYTPKSKVKWKVLEETDSAWVNIRHDLHFIKGEEKFLWVSEKSGLAQVYLYDYRGNELKQFTKSGDEVRQVLLVDEDAGVFYYEASDGDPRESHLWRVQLDGLSAKQKLTRDRGSHTLAMVKGARFFVDTHSTVTQPPQTLIKDFSDQTLYVLAANQLTAEHPLKPYLEDLPTWEMDKLELSGEPPRYYMFLRPPFFDAKKKYPLIHYVYGGPGVQLVHNKWLGDRGLMLQHLAQQGFIVLVADNLGTPHRGRDFARAIFLKLGQVEVADQGKILKRVTQKHSFIDAHRIGVFGHSYGGYMSLMLLFQYPSLYKVAVAGAPVVDWRLYDTHYTERYLGRPDDQPNAFRQACVLSHLPTFDGRLLLVHGMADDNVIYEHSLLLYQQLQAQGKLFDIMAYPGAKHGLRGEALQIHYYSSIKQYFTDHLLANEK